MKMVEHKHTGGVMMVDKVSRDSGVVSGEYVIGAMIILAALLLSATIYVSSSNLQKSIEGVKLSGGAAVPGGALAAPAPAFKDVKAKVEKFLDGNILSARGMTANVTIIEPYDEYLSVATVNVISAGKVTQTVPLYITKDGGSVLIGDTVYKTNETLPASQTAPPAQAAPAANISKADKPQVTAYVMSYCPFGLQMLKAIVPAMEKLGDKADIKIGFVSYIMHGYKEIEGNNYIYCVQKDNKPKLTAYLRCAVEAGDYKGCLNKTGISEASTLSCAAALDTQYNTTGLYNDKSTWLSGYYPLYNVDKADNVKYGVGSSPSVVINGVLAQNVNVGKMYVSIDGVINRNAEYVKNLICESFKTPPAECSQKLSELDEAPGAGAIGAGASATGGAAASCG